MWKASKFCTVDLPTVVLNVTKIRPCLMLNLLLYCFPKTNDKLNSIGVLILGLGSDGGTEALNLI